MILAVLAAVCAVPSPSANLFAQAPPAAPAASRQIGTIRSIDSTTLVLTTDKGEQVSIGLSAETKVLQLAAGSIDLKTAQPATLADVAVGDRALAVGAPAEAPLALTARRLILMKSTDIAQRRATEQAQWQHGSGGLVSAVDPASGTITVSAGSRLLTIATGATTIFRRYAPTSARFEDATPSTLADLHPGDQLRVRGERGEAGAIKAEEIVSGSFRHLSGTIQSVNAAASQITVKDLKTSKPVVLSLSPGTALHRLPAEEAARFAARPKSAAAGASGSTIASRSAGGTPPATAGAPGGEAPATRGGDLSQVVSRLPPATLSDFKAGDAVMVVGSDGNAGAIAALTLLGGVEPILAASPSGGAEMALSPWSMGGGESAGGAAQ